MSDTENTKVPPGTGPESNVPSCDRELETASGAIARKVSDASLRGLDWFAFFMADIQTGWGPFVAAYLTSVGWLQFNVGIVLTIGTMAGFVLQVPVGAVVDAVPAKRLLAAIAVACISASALLLATWPAFSLGLVGHALLSVRLGRNARFLSLGNAIAAAIMGVIGYYFTNRAIFLFTAGLGLPTLLSSDLGAPRPSTFARAQATVAGKRFSLFSTAPGFLLRKCAPQRDAAQIQP
jgi:hypothetical protein